MKQGVRLVRLVETAVLILRPACSSSNVVKFKSVMFFMMHLTPLQMYLI